ncbi:uncharacterized protein LOC130828561 [Amaranthus tricolor]|uniref:uncharacterized protein LOC130828561 n=1 Tax=Amaranthus tricolor TaxID=29722 RepID=UPI00258778EE|nr:uncharacterized protein LOC130828561 [Amaranthus tricolor]
MIGHIIAIHNGREHLPIYIMDRMGRLKEEYESEKPDEITTRGQSISMSADKARRRNREIDEDVTHRIQAGWLKWRATIGVLCDIKFPSRLKEWRMEVTEFHMMRSICGCTVIYRIRNHEFREKLGVVPLSAKIHENRLRWFGQV